MRIRNKPFHISIILLVTAVWLSACSSERKNPISKTYHNTTARYNAYYYANERIKEIKGLVEAAEEHNYNDILNVFPKFDTAMSSTYKTQTEDCIKKASIAIQIHKNSKWVDDSYILIGLARYYDSDFVNAIETFKYVNTKSEDDDARHQALAHLLRVFADYGEYNNAIAVSDYLKKETINTQNQKLLYLNKAHLYQLQEDYDNVVQNLVLAAPLMSHSEGQARIYFIIGQIYQMLGFDSEAYNNYQLCLNNNPVYELYFYARLNMAQVAELSKESDIRNIRKHFKKLLTDKKNLEFKDKIYYEMAEFEARQNNIDEAIENYSLSAYTSVNNKRQKGMSYLKLGMIYYDTINDYSIAKAYYDSAIQALPKDFDNYEAINERKNVLDNFVKQLKTIELQDSLLSLAAMDSVTVMIKLDQMIADQEAKKKLAEAKAKRRVQNTKTYISPFDTGNNNKGGASWYFDNPSAVSLGRSEFKRKWGNRTLEDNWRRSKRTTDLSSINTSTNTSSDKVETESNGSDSKKTQAVGGTNSSELFSQIPFSEIEKKKALGQIEEAYYALGNIYHFDLLEDPNAVNSFETLLSRFSDSEHEPEVLYLLYIITNDRSENYKNTLLSKYPNSTYAKLAINPKYTEESGENTTKMKAAYKIAYDLYKKKQYEESRILLREEISKYPETSFTANMKLLDILLTGQLENDDKYKYELDTFIKQYPDSEVTPYALTLQEAVVTFNERVEQSKTIQYIADFSQVHYFVMVYESKQNITDKVATKLKDFNSTYYESLALNTGTLTLNDEYAIALVTEFNGIETSLNYLTKYDEGKQAFEILSNSKIDTFVITKDNFGILYKSGGVKEYLKFFKQHY